ncbi:MAG TPA: carnitine dehydratase [Actinobacteria bacterium]|nr:carnitine dehydratase [Actinomycetota bacterium]
MPRPLEGIRLLDLSQGAAGPTCAMLLADLGAQVVKVEPPGGEWGRGLGPPFVGGTAAAFLAMNRNKRGIVIDVKRPGGAGVVLRLAERSDVVVESLRPGVADRLGIGYQAMAARNPRLVYAAVSAFGQDGPWRDRPGVDGVVQAMSGLMSVTGTAGGAPVKAGVPAADMVGAMMCGQGILAALLSRERTGRGERVDVSLLDALLAFQVVPLAMYLASGERPVPQGSAAPYAAPNEAFPTRDGHVMVAAYTPERWPRLCAALGVPDLATDPRFDTNSKRVQARPALREVLEPLFRARTTAEWVTTLEDADVMCAPLLAYPELVVQEHIECCGMLVRTAHPDIGEVRSPRNPVRLSDAPAVPAGGVPLHPGEHTGEVLADFGFGPHEVRSLVAEGVVQTASRTDPARV